VFETVEDYQSADIRLLLRSGQKPLDMSPCKKVSRGFMPARLWCLKPCGLPKEKNQYKAKCLPGLQSFVVTVC
jgi:hypothetical protein